MKDAAKEAMCELPVQKSTLIDSKSPNLFQDLTTDELIAVRDYLRSQKALNLTAYAKATLRDSFMYTIELFLPSKDVVLKYLDKGGPKPQRQARVIIFHGSEKVPFLQEYLVQYLPKPTRYTKLRLKNRKTTIPFHGRPFTFKDSAESLSLINKVTEEAYPLLKESFGSWVHNCTDNCLDMLAIGEPGKHESGKRYSWVRFLISLLSA